jgi:hypothetical protein
VRACCGVLTEHRPWLALEGLRVVYTRNVGPDVDQASRPPN